MNRAVISAFFYLLAFQICTCFTVSAQQAGIQDLFTDYERVLHVTGISQPHNMTNQPFIHDYISQIDTLSGHPWENIFKPGQAIYNSGNFQLSLFDPEIRTYWRNLRPGGINNGPVWEGRGFTNAFNSGMFVRYRFISAAFRPVIIYNQNQHFSLSRYPPRTGRSEFSSPFYNIDTPQRFGDAPFWTFDPGQSYIKATIKGFEAGYSSQNRWWGPALHHPVIMSNNAPGFRHFFAGTQKPRDIYIGDLELSIIWGKLLESDYFDNQSFNDERYLTGILLSVNPRPVPNLTLGVTRVYYRRLPPEGIPVRDIFRVFEAFTKSSVATSDNPGGNDEFSQMISVFGRWVFPESGLEIYGEWARNDHSWNLRDFLGEPEHTRAYTAGLQKTFTLSNTNILAMNAELVQMEGTFTRTNRPDVSWYTHGIVHQGYTHKGQVIGMGYGPGSNNQLLKGKYFHRNGKISGWFRRTVYDNEELYRRDFMLNEPENLDMAKYWLHNFELGFGASAVFFFSRFETEISLELAREYNDDFIYKNDQTHVAASLRLRYRLSSLR